MKSYAESRFTSTTLPRKVYMDEIDGLAEMLFDIAAISSYSSSESRTWYAGEASRRSREIATDAKRRDIEAQILKLRLELDAL